MIELLVGMDFGTTNSGMAWFDGNKVNLLPLDPANRNPAVARTALYIGNNQDVAIGRDAIDQYFEQNVGRATKLKKVWVGEVEVYGADMYYVTDVYAWVDIMSPGRLFLSLKSGLRDPDFSGTMVGRFYYSLETLVAAYLSLTKMRAERLLDREVTGIVLGRPVHFSLDPKDDALAENRLLEAALNAGYKEVYFQYEPVAAAYHYAESAAQEQNILIFDFGGGTLDITIMRIGTHMRQVLATGGIPVAGDIFDQKLVRAKLPKHFGEGSRYGPPARRLPLPAWIFDLFSNWQTIIELQTPDNRKILSEIAQTADDRQGLSALISLVVNNYGLKMFDVIESTKRQLSTDMASLIRFHGPDFRVVETVSRSEFEQIIAAEIRAVSEYIDELVLQAGLALDDIDAVIRTGGSAEIPAFKRLLAGKFGANKVRGISTFSSVTSGLGIMAQAISNGELAAAAKRSAELSREVTNQSEVDLSPINLLLLQKRMAAKEQLDSEDGETKEKCLVLLRADGILKLVSGGYHGLDGLQINDLGVNKLDQEPYRNAIFADQSTPLLIGTNYYRFFLSSPALLSDLQDLGMDAANFYHFKEDESITAVGRWLEIKKRTKLLVATNQGYGRTYPLEKIAETLEGHASLEFDQLLPGAPLALIGVEDDESIVALTNGGRAVKIEAGSIPQLGRFLLKPEEDDRVICASVLDPQVDLILVTADGYGKRLPEAWIEVATNGSSRGRKVISRSNVRGVAAAGSEFWALTADKIINLDERVVPVDSKKTTRAYSIKALKKLQPVLGLVTGH